MTRAHDHSDLASFGDAVAALAHTVGRMTELTEVLRGLSLNDVLRAELLTFDVNGVAEISTSVPAAQLVVQNLGTGTVYVAQTPNAGRAGSTSGVGVFEVPPGTRLPVMLAGTQWAFHGKPGERVQVTAHSSTAPQAAFASPAPAQPVYGVDVGLGVLGDGTVYTTVHGQPLILAGFWFAEIAGASASVVLRDGGAAGTARDRIALAANESTEVVWDRPHRYTSTSIYMDVTGTLLGGILVH